MKSKLPEKTAKTRAFKISFNLFLPILFLMAVSAVNAETIIPLNTQKQQTKVVNQSKNSLELQFSYDAIRAFDVQTKEGEFQELIFSNGYSTGPLGTPKLPASKNLIEIPFGAQLQINIKSFSTQEISLNDFGLNKPIIPVQPSLRKDQRSDEVPFEFIREAYNKSAYNETELVTTEVLGVMRGMRLARVEVAPVKYNPSTNTIKVYNDIQVEISFKNADHSLTEYIKQSTFSPFFLPLYSKILNKPTEKSVFDDHPDLTKEPVKMLMVADRMFEETLQPFIDWKTQMGIEVIIAYTDEIGSSANDIETYVHNQYNAGTPDDPAPTFLVLVGDNAQIPASTIGSSSQKVTDLYYASVDGDYFPEMYHGRLSARNTTELQNQIEKILYYQKYEFADASYLDDVTLIAGADGNWNPKVGQPTVEYGTENYFNESNGFTTVNDYLSSYSGCYDDDRISVSLINYTAHCSPTSWGDPNLGISDIYNMGNTGKYPISIGNCCLSGLFSEGECIGEAWVRSPEKGAVTYIGSAPNTYWFEDFYWAVGAFPLVGSNDGYVPTAEETTLGVYDAPFNSDYLAVGALKFVGNLAVTEVDIENYPQHSSPLYYWQAYHTFGDPSQFIYYTQGLENEVSHMPILPIGLDTYTVTAEPGSYVAISKDGVLHGAAFVGETGEVEVPIEPVLDGGDVTITVSKAQYIPYIQNVPAAALEGPFVVLDSYEVSNNEEGFVSGETATINVTIKNVGADNAVGVEGQLLIDDPYFSLVNTETVIFGDVEAGDSGNTTTLQDAFTIEVATDVPDQYASTFILDLTDGNESWQSNLQVIANAPKLDFETVVINDGGELNPGVLDPGETAEVIVTVTNNGHATSEEGSVDLLTDSPWVSIGSGSDEITSLAAGESDELVFSITAVDASPPEVPADLNFTATTGDYTFEDTYEIIIGQAPVYDLGDIPTTYNQNVTTGSVAAEPGVMTVTIPEGATITGVDVEYAMTATGGGWTSEQRSFLKCVTEGGTAESTVSEGSGGSAGTMEYSRTGLDLANGVVGGGEIVFELHAFRTWGGSGSNTQYNYVNNNTWKVIVYFDLPGYSANFVIVDETGNSVEGAVVSINGNSYPEGQYEINNIIDGSYNYTVSKYAYETAEGSFDMAGEDVTVNAELQSIPTYEAVFNVTDDDGNAVSDAIISVNDIDYAAGEYTIGNLIPETYSYVVSKDGFLTATGEFEIVDQNENVSIELIEVFTLSFNITDANGEVTDAAITIDGNTHQPGEHIFHDMMPGTHNYTVSKENYYPVEGTFTIEDADMVMDIFMIEIINEVHFYIMDENGNALEDAIITFDGNEHQPGVYTMLGIDNGLYSYSVKKEGFENHSGNVMVSNSDIEVDIVLVAVVSHIIENRNEVIMSVYPNPSNGIFTVKLGNVSSDMSINVMNYQGQIVKTISSDDIDNDQSFNINLVEHATGIYYLRVENENTVEIRKLVIR